MRRYGFLAAGAALLLGTVSAAADGGAADASDEHYDWSGVYVGLQGGWLWGRNEVRELFTNTGVLNQGPFSYDANGYTIGGVAGVNLQFGHWLYGGEVDVAYSDFSGGFLKSDGNILRKKVNVMGSLRARIGFALDRVLIYGAGGVATGLVRMTAIDNYPPVLGSIADQQTPFGYTYGGGLQVAISDNWAVGAEYRYTDFGEASHSGYIFGNDFTYPHTNRVQSVLARFVYRLPI